MTRTKLFSSDMPTQRRSREILAGLSAGELQALAVELLERHLLRNPLYARMKMAANVGALNTRYADVQRAIAWFVTTYKADYLRAAGIAGYGATRRSNVERSKNRAPGRRGVSGRQAGRGGRGPGRRPRR